MCRSLSPNLILILSQNRNLNRILIRNLIRNLSLCRSRNRTRWRHPQTHTSRRRRFHSSLSYRTRRSTGTRGTLARSRCSRGTKLRRSCRGRLQSRGRSTPVAMATAQPTFPNLRHRRLPPNRLDIRHLAPSWPRSSTRRRSSRRNPSDTRRSGCCCRTGTAERAPPCRSARTSSPTCLLGTLRSHTIASLASSNFPRGTRPSCSSERTGTLTRRPLRHSAGTALTSGTQPRTQIGQTQLSSPKRCRWALLFCFCSKKG